MPYMTHTSSQSRVNPLRTRQSVRDASKRQNVLQNVKCYKMSSVTKSHCGKQLRALAVAMSRDLPAHALKPLPVVLVEALAHLKGFMRACFGVWGVGV